MDLNLKPAAAQTPDKANVTLLDVNKVGKSEATNAKAPSKGPSFASMLKNPAAEEKPALETKPKEPSKPTLAPKPKAQEKISENKAERKLEPKTPPKTQTAKAAPATAIKQAPPTETTGEKDQVLQKIAKLLGKGERALRTNPILAMVAGRLEHVNPQDIPNLVANSGFLQKALASGEMGEFLTTSAPLGDLLKQLNVPPLMLSHAEEMGLNLAESLTPKDLLNALSLDPQVVQTELSLMKANVQLDGLNQYMVRAEKLKQKHQVPLPAQLPTIETPAVAVLQQQNTLAPMAPLNVAMDEEPYLDYSNYSQPGVPSPVSYSANAAAHPQMPLRQGPMQVAQPVKNHRLSEQTYNAPALGATSPTMPQVKPVNAAPANLAADKLFATLAAEAKTPLDVKIVVPGDTAEFDPTQYVQNKIQPSTATHTQFPTQTIPSPNVSGATSNLLSRPLSLEEQLMAQELYKPAPGSQPTNGFLAQTPPTFASSLPLTGMNSAQAVLATNTLENISLDPTMSKELTPVSKVDVAATSTHPTFLGAAMDASVALPKIDGASSRLETSTVSQGINPLIAVLPSEGKGREFSSDANLGQREENSMTSTQALHAVPSKLGASVESFQNSLEASANNPADAVKNVAHQVQEKVSSLVNQGGGSLLMDLGSKEFGKLEIAIDVKNDNIDLKIVTGNEQLRDLLSSDLSKLKDSLGEQNLQLNKVEIGVNRDAMLGQNLSQEHRQANAQSFNQYSDAESAAQAARRTANPRTMQPTLPFVNRFKPAHNGRIQVYA